MSCTYCTCTYTMYMHTHTQCHTHTMYTTSHACLIGMCWVAISMIWICASVIKYLIARVARDLWRHKPPLSSGSALGLGRFTATNINPWHPCYNYYLVACMYTFDRLAAIVLLICRNEMHSARVSSPVYTFSRCCTCCQSMQGESRLKNFSNTQ